MKTAQLALTLLIALILISTGCKKEIQGPKGDPGTPGVGGNANLTASSEFIISTADWDLDSTTNAWNVAVSIPLLTKTVVDAGSVKPYIKINGAWWELPYITGDYSTQFGFDVGVLKLRVTAIHGGIPVRPATAHYRIVIISEG